MFDFVKWVEDISNSPLRMVQYETFYKYFGSGYIDKEHLFLELPTGSGKSLIASAIAKYWTDRGNSVAILTETKQLQIQYVNPSGITARFGLVPVYSPEGQIDFDAAKARRNSNIDDYNDASAAAVFSVNGYFNYRMLGMALPPDIMIIDEAHNLAETVRQFKSLGLPGRAALFLAEHHASFRDTLLELQSNAAKLNMDDEDVYVPQNESDILKSVYSACAKVAGIIEEETLKVLNRLYQTVETLDQQGKLKSSGEDSISTYDCPKYKHLLFALGDDCNLQIVSGQIGIGRDVLKRFVEIARAYCSDDYREMVIETEDASDSPVLGFFNDYLQHDDLYLFFKEIKKFLFLYPVVPSTADIGIAYNLKDDLISLSCLNADIKKGILPLGGAMQTIFMSGSFLDCRQYAGDLGISAEGLGEVSATRGDEPAIYSGQRMLLPLNICNLRRGVNARSPKPYPVRLRQSINSVKTIIRMHGKAAVLLASIEDMDEMEAALKNSACRVYRIGGKVTADIQEKTIRDFIADKRNGVVLLSVRWEGVDLKGISAVVLHRLPIGITARHKILEQRLQDDTLFFKMVSPETMRKVVQGCGRANRDSMANGIGVYYLLDNRFRGFFEHNKALMPRYIKTAYGDGLKMADRCRQDGIKSTVERGVSYVSTLRGFAVELSQTVWAEDIKEVQQLEAWGSLPFNVLNRAGDIKAYWQRAGLEPALISGNSIVAPRSAGSHACWFLYRHMETGFFVVKRASVNVKPVATVSVNRLERYLKPSIVMTCNHPDISHVTFGPGNLDETCIAGGNGKLVHLGAGMSFENNKGAITVHAVIKGCLPVLIFNGGVEHSYCDHIRRSTGIDLDHVKDNIYTFTARGISGQIEIRGFLTGETPVSLSTNRKIKKSWLVFKRIETSMASKAMTITLSSDDKLFLRRWSRKHAAILKELFAASESFATHRPYRNAETHKENNVDCWPSCALASQLPAT